MAPIHILSNTDEGLFVNVLETMKTHLGGALERFDAVDVQSFTSEFTRLRRMPPAHAFAPRPRGYAQAGKLEELQSYSADTGELGNFGFFQIHRKELPIFTEFLL